MQSWRRFHWYFDWIIGLISIAGLAFLVGKYAQRDLASHTSYSTNTGDVYGELSFSDREAFVKGAKKIMAKYES